LTYETVTDAVRALVDSLEIDQAGQVRASAAFRIASTIDGGAPPYTLAGLSSELRSLVAELVTTPDDEAAAEWLAGLRESAARKMRLN
jgi:hypothetical protein